MWDNKNYKILIKIKEEKEGTERLFKVLWQHYSSKILDPYYNIKTE